MDNSTRLEYLSAMGIDVWIPRETAVTEELQPIYLTDEIIAEPIHESALEPDSWSVLEKEVAACQKCALCQTRSQTILGAGQHNADWMLIGEAPNQEEEQEGQPFVEQTGRLLTEMIRAIGVERDTVYITNIIKCRPPEKRDPKVDELKHCNDYLQRQIALVKPKIILAIGRIAAHALLGTNEPLATLRGQPLQLNGIPLVVIYHPAYLLRSLPEKRKAWDDLQLAIKQIKN